MKLMDILSTLNLKQNLQVCEEIICGVQSSRFTFCFPIGACKAKKKTRDQIML